MDDMRKILLGLAVRRQLILYWCSGHAPGYGDTAHCTICGAPATHKTSNYGYCDKHWKDATGN